VRPPLRTAGEVARWAAARAHETGEAQVLWVRVVNGGPGYQLEPEGTAGPRGGIGWQPVSVISTEAATAIAGGGYTAWLALSRLAEEIAASRG